MLSDLDLSVEVTKADYKQAKPELDLRLGALQRRARELHIPILIVFEGWGAAGKGTLINELILPLDPRGFKVWCTKGPTEEESLFPFLWRFWERTPERGRMAIFDRSWYRQVTNDRIDGAVKGKGLEQAFRDIVSFERQLATGGCLILKFFLHISKKEQKKRFAGLQEDSSTAWRVTDEDFQHHTQFKNYLAAFDDMLGRTDTEFAPWTVIEAHDRRHATLKMFRTVIAALETRLEQLEAGAAAASPRSKAAPVKGTSGAMGSVLDRFDLTRTLAREEYEAKLDKRQSELRELEYQIYQHRIPVVIAFEGWDAAGKGGTIRRLTQKLDPRGYEVVPVAAPTDTEKAHHYLWRFWTHMPKGGHITIFDRTWYGRVLVERVEGFCTPEDWQRAYREINEMEEHLAGFGAVIAKFWLHIDRKEQIRRFRERERLEYKQWKITPEDWRNREKWDLYHAAVDEMLVRTSTAHAPWTVVEANCKYFGRIKVLDTVIAAMKQQLKGRG